MTEEELSRLARDRGLDLLLRLFPQDVAVAAATVAQQRRHLVHAFRASDEPWPEMRVDGE